MNKLECMNKMITLWSWLAYNSDVQMPAGLLKKKAYKILGLSKDIMDCPCCEYTRQGRVGLYCPDCILYDQWMPKDAVLSGGVGPCLQEGSPYEAWHMSLTNEEQSQHAWEVWHLAWMNKTRILAEKYKKEEEERNNDQS